MVLGSIIMIIATLVITHGWTILKIWQILVRCLQAVRCFVEKVVLYQQMTVHNHQILPKIIYVGQS